MAFTPGAPGSNTVRSVCSPEGEHSETNPRQLGLAAQNAVSPFPNWCKCGVDTVQDSKVAKPHPNDLLLQIEPLFLLVWPGIMDEGDGMNRASCGLREHEIHDLGSLKRLC